MVIAFLCGGLMMEISRTRSFHTSWVSQALRGNDSFQGAGSTVHEQSTHTGEDEVWEIVVAAIWCQRATVLRVLRIRTSRPSNHQSR